MFSDFDKKKKESPEERRRIGLSLAVSSVVYVVAAVGIAAAVATAKVVVDRQERDVEIQFAAAPTPPKKEQPKPKPKVVEKKEAKKETEPGQKRGLNAPTEIPDEELKEATGGRLADVEEINIDEMIGGGGVEGKKRGPRQKRETVSRPKYLGGCNAPEIPVELRASAKTIRVRVRILVMPNGVPIKAELEKSDPLIPDESIIKCALAQRFEPARLPDGTAVPYPYRRQFTFKPSAI
jgi:flagellar basal body-associated protein FliL